jgi:hypothetical protein
VNRPIRLAIVDDYAVVIAGVASFLAEERIDVVETGASLPVVSDVDVVLYDTFGQVQGQDIDLEDFVRDSGAKVVIYSWNLRPDLIDEAIAGGACGYLSKVLTGPVIVQALERIMTGEIVILAGDHETSVDGVGDWPGRAAGLVSTRGRGPGAHLPRTEQPRDCRTCPRQHQLDQVLHPVRLPQDRRRATHAGTAVGAGQRLPTRHRAHCRSRTTHQADAARAQRSSSLARHGRPS